MVTRCAWVGKDDMLAAYHDEEWGVPEFDSRALWESLMLSGFQAGLSWLTILRKREAFRLAFQGFEPKVIARYGAKDLARLLANSAIIRSKSKINATITGAQIYQDMLEHGDDFSTFVWHFVGQKPIQNLGPIPPQTPLSAKISDALKARGFKFVGPVIVYAWMQSVGMVNDHSPDCLRRKAVRTPSHWRSSRPPK
jgi:DNA-3-methyladenine glycosylase I